MFISSYYYQVSAIASLQVYVSFMEFEWIERVLCAELKLKKSPKNEKEV